MGKQTEKNNQVFSKPVKKKWFEATTNNVQFVQNALDTDLALFMQHEKSVEKARRWTVFNQALSKHNPEITTIEYIPIFKAPAYELYTLNYVVKRCLQFSSLIGQQYTILTVDQTLYCKLMELKWATPEYQNKLIPRLGGLHT